MRLSSIALIGGALLSGVVSVAPAFAGGLSSSATFITPAGFTSTVSAEVVLPAGAFFLTPGASVLTDSTLPVLVTPAIFTTAPVIGVAPTVLSPGVPASPGVIGIPPTVADAGVVAVAGVISVPAIFTPGTKTDLSNAAVIAVPQFSLQGFSVALESLSVGSNGVVTVLPGASFTAAAATVLTSAAAAGAPSGAGATFSNAVGAVIYRSTNIEFIAAIIKAGAGVSGLD
jgi:hypothetical protein